MGYFKGNTRARRLRMKKIHEQFLKHQKRWIMRRMIKHFGAKK